MPQPRTVAALLVLIILTLTAAGCGHAGPQASPQPSVAPVCWVRLGHVSLDPQQFHTSIGPVHLLSGRVRVVVDITGDPGKRGVYVGAWQVSSAQFVPGHAMWAFTRPGLSRESATLAPGHWNFSVDRAPGARVSVSVFERR